MTTSTAYTVTCPYFQGGDNTRRSNDEGLAMVAEINKMAADQGYSTERVWFEQKVREYDPEGLWGLAVDSYEVEIDE